MKAAIYTRVSTLEQEKEGTSLQSQLEACRKYCQDKGYEIAYQFSESYSGLSLERPELEALRELVRSKQVDIVVSYALDRLSRDPVQFILLQDEIEKFRVELAFVTETVDATDMGKLISHIKGYAAKLEALKIRERTMRGMKERLKSGKLPGGSRSNLYGYDYIPGRGEGEGVRVINEAQSEIVSKIFSWYANEGCSINDLSNRLESMGIPSIGGRKWAASSLYQILKNQSYIGKTYVNTKHFGEGGKHIKPDRKIKVTHVVYRPESEWLELKNATPQIISKELFAKAQGRLQINRENSKRNCKRDYLLRGHVFCKVCGHRFAGLTNLDKTSSGFTPYVYYRCTSKGKVNQGCSTHSVRAEALESLVWNKILEALSKPETVLSGLEAISKEQSSIQIAEADLLSVVKRLDSTSRTYKRNWDLYLTTGDESLKDEVVLRLKKELDLLTSRKLELEARIQALKSVKVDIEDIKTACNKLMANVQNATFETKRLILSTLRIKVWIDDKNVPSMEGILPAVTTKSASLTPGTLLPFYGDKERIQVNVHDTAVHG